MVLTNNLTNINRLVILKKTTNRMILRQLLHLYGTSFSMIYI